MTNHAVNIARRFRSATADELEKGCLWYRQAHSLARLLAAVGRCSVDAAAGVLAALSPMNRWEDNVADAFAMARSITATVRTTGANREKAAQILAGAPPETVLSGRKVLAFWEGIRGPFGCRVIAVDRHLYRAALDEDVWFRAAAPPAADYGAIQAAFLDASGALGLPLTAVASVTWLVMRRLGTFGQRGLPFLRKTRPEAAVVNLPGHWPGTITEDRRGRLKIYLGKKHPAANSGGWTWLPRFIVWRETGQVLRPDEHVHHDCQHADALRCTIPAHFSVVLAEYHGRIHGAATLLWRQRDAGGRFLPQPPTFPIPRYGAILGRSAAELLRGG